MTCDADAPAATIAVDVVWPEAQPQVIGPAVEAVKRLLVIALWLKLVAARPQRPRILPR